RPWFERLTKTKLEWVTTDAKPPKDADLETVPTSFGVAQTYLPLGGLIDKDARRKDLSAKVEKLRPQIAAIETKLGNDGSVGRAPADVVGGERERLAALKDEAAKLRAALDELGV